MSIVEFDLRVIVFSKCVVHSLLCNVCWSSCSRTYGTRRVIESIQKDLAGRDDVVYQNRMEDYNRLIEAMQEVKSAYNVKNNAVALMLVLDVYERHKDDILNVAFTERQEKDWIDLSLVLGTSRIPVEAAKVLNRAIDQMTARKEIKAKNRWQAIEYLSADYLGQ